MLHWLIEYYMRSRAMLDAAAMPPRRERRRRDGYACLSRVGKMLLTSPRCALFSAINAMPPVICTRHAIDALCRACHARCRLMPFLLLRLLILPPLIRDLFSRHYAIVCFIFRRRCFAADTPDDYATLFAPLCFSLPTSAAMPLSR